jgi:hypothetical protein
MINLLEAERLEREAEQNNGRCPGCHQSIKIYRYTANKAVAIFMRAMANSVRESGINDVDLTTIGLPYSIRTQVAKIRQHGLIARVKDERGTQLASRWLITTKGWAFVNGAAIHKRVIVFNNQVLGHDGGTTTISTILGERFDPNTPLYEEAPVTTAEARTYRDVRKPQRRTEYQAIYRGRKTDKLMPGEVHTLGIDRLAMGKPIDGTILSAGSQKIQYRDIAAFQREWRMT